MKRVGYYIDICAYKAMLHIHCFFMQYSEEIANETKAVAFSHTVLSTQSSAPDKILKLL